MRAIILEEAKPGDEVAEPVKNDRGMVILTKGTRLSLPLIDKLRKMGVHDLVVEGNDPNAPPPKTPEELEAELDERFEGLENNKMMMTIFRIAKDHLKKESD